MDTLKGEPLNGLGLRIKFVRGDSLGTSRKEAGKAKEKKKREREGRGKEVGGERILPAILASQSSHIIWLPVEDRLGSSRVHAHM